MPAPGNTALEISTQEPLKPYTTFKIGGPARYFARVETLEALRQALQFAAERRLALFILGGGSNILVSDHGFDGLVIHVALRGIEVTAENDASVTLRIAAGETWDGVVALAVERGWWGIENLSHIPGQAGAALVQNIGAYGAEIRDVFESAEVLEIRSGQVKSLAAAACGFAYRRSIFNSSRKGEYVILSLKLRLAKQGQANLQYPDVAAYFAQRGVTEPALPQLREAIIAIRDRKFPFPREERGGNAGSFFKNLWLTEPEYRQLERAVRAQFAPEVAAKLESLHGRRAKDGRVKIPTAFLIEACGLKGYQMGRAQVNETQPLVLLNRGGASAHEVLTLARHIRQTVYARTGLVIELEPELVGFTRQELDEYLAL
jgi:UDP-N-acetylmuramate dehydrogenase